MIITFNTIRQKLVGLTGTYANCDSLSISNQRTLRMSHSSEPLSSVYRGHHGWLQRETAAGRRRSPHPAAAAQPGSAQDTQGTVATGPGSTLDRLDRITVALGRFIEEQP